MCRIIADILVVLGNWSESCLCHSKLWKLKSRSVRGKYVERLRKWKQLIRRGGVEDSSDPTVHMWSQCPMGGKHAAEFACGFFLQLLEQKVTEGMAEVLTFCIGLSESELQSVTNAYSEGKAYVLAILVLKLQYWTLIPWKLWLIPLDHSFGNSMCIRLPCSVQSTAD